MPPKRDPFGVVFPTLDVAFRTHFAEPSLETSIGRSGWHLGRRKLPKRVPRNPTVSKKLKKSAPSDPENLHHYANVVCFLGDQLFRYSFSHRFVTHFVHLLFSKLGWFISWLFRRFAFDFGRQTTWSTKKGRRNSRRDNNYYIYLLTYLRTYLLTN